MLAHPKQWFAVLLLSALATVVGWYSWKRPPADVAQQSARTYLGKPATFWMSKLEHEDLSYRLLAIRALGNIGPEAKAAIPYLVAGHKKKIGIGNFDTADEVPFLPGYAVAKALRKIDPESARLIPADMNASTYDLEQFDAQELEEINVTNSEARLRAYEALAKVSFDRGRVNREPLGIDEITNALDHGNEEIRASMIRHCVNGNNPEFRKLIPSIVGVLKASKSHQTRWECMLALEQFAPDDALPIPDVIDTLKDSSDFVRNAAVKTLGKIGPAAIPRLREILHHPHGPFRAEGTHALAAMGLVAKEMVPELRELLNDQDPGVRSGAAVALWKVGRESKGVVLVLSEDLQTGNHTQAARILGEMGPEAVAAIPAMVKFLEGDHYGSVWEVTQALGAIGPPAKLAVPALIKVMGSRVVYVDVYPRTDALRALQKIQPEIVVPTLLKLVEDPHGQVQNWAFNALRWIDPQSAAKLKKE